MAKPRQIKNEILRLRDQNYTYDQIAKELNCSKSTVSYHCVRQDVNDIGLTKHKISEEMAEDIYSFCKEHKIKEAMAHFGLSESTIKKYKKKAPNDEG
jgi:IS30 family transposase